MARLSAKLTNLQVRMAPPGVHADGGGLYLQVREGATGPDGKKCCTRSWIYRYTVNDRQTWLGLGSYPTVSLATAREKATDARRLRADGIDPLAQKRVERAALSQERARPLPFVECAAAYIESHQSAWRSTRHAQQWVRSLATHVHPIIGKVLVTDIDTALVMRVLEPIWSTKTETAARIRVALSSSWTGRLCWAIEAALTPPDGAGVSTTSYRPALRCGRSDITPHSLTEICPRSLSRCDSVKPSLRNAWSF
jgi:hypothetical protein